MENLISPQLDIPVSELEHIFSNAFSKDTSRDPIGRTEYGIRDRFQCGTSAFVLTDIVDQAKLMWQKVGIIDPSQELRVCLERCDIKKRTFKHYKTLLSDGQQIDFTNNQLNYRWELVFGNETIIDTSVTDIEDYIQVYGKAFLERCNILKANVIEEISFLFRCPPEDIRKYLETQKFRLVI